MGDIMNSTIVGKPSNMFIKVKRRVLNIFLDIIFVLLILISILLVINFISLKSGNSNYPLFGAYVIVSPSMVPTINVNDAVVIKRADVSDLNKGDIITFASSDARYLGYTITHRIFDVESDSTGNIIFRTKGDNNNAVDSAPVLSENVFGKVIFIVPSLGKIQGFLSRPIGWFLLVIVPCGCLIIFDILSIIKRSNRFKDNSGKSDDIEIL